VDAVDAVARDVGTDTCSVGSHLESAAAGAASADGGAAGQAQGGKVNDWRIDEDGAAFGEIKGDMEQAKGIADMSLPGAQSEKTPLAADAICAPYDGLMPVGTADRAGGVTRQVRLVVDLDPDGREKGIVADGKAFFEEVAHVDPAVVLLTGKDEAGSQLPGPKVTESQYAAQAEKKEGPSPAGYDELHEKQGRQEAQEPTSPMLDLEYRRILSHRC
jgi:hypothetical protein